MTLVCTLGYLNQPPRPLDTIILADLQQKNGGRVPVDALQWIQLPPPARCPKMPTYNHADAGLLDRIAHSPEGYALYAAYDVRSLRVFWMVTKESKR